MLTLIFFIYLSVSRKNIVFFSRIIHDAGNMGEIPTSTNELDRRVYTTTEVHIDYYNKISRGQLEKMVSLVQEHITIGLMTIYLEKQSGLRENIDMAVLQLIAHGFQSKWMSEYGIMVRMHKRKEKIPQQLTLNQMCGVFIISGGLYAFAALVFVLEVILGNRMINSRPNIFRRI